MKIKAANGFARILKAEGIPWVSCYPTNHVKRAFDENARGRPAFLEFLCSHHPVHGGWVRPA
jgi:hypothetical protein